MEKIKFEQEKNPEVKVRCRCGHSSCGLEVEISTQELDKITNNHEVVIVDGCQNNYLEDKDLVEKREGYSVYTLGRPKNISPGGGWVRPGGGFVKPL